MKKILGVVFLLASLCELSAQQLPQFTNYMLNDYVLNPALTGAKEDFEVKADYRQQWVGITDAPVTYYLSANGPILSKNMGLGGYVYNDVTGPTKRLGLSFSYAYHAKLTEKVKLSLGLSGGLLQYSIDGSQILTHDQSDPALTNLIQTTLVPDFGFGAIIRSDKYYIGFSVPQMYQNKVNFTGVTTAASSLLTRHYYVSAGYNYNVNENVKIEPSFMLNMSPPAPAQMSFNLRVTYKKQYWAGLGYRSGDAIPFMVGYTWSDFLMFAYAYDAVISGLHTYTSGSHELMVGIKFKSRAKTETPAVPTAIQ